MSETKRVTISIFLAAIIVSTVHATEPAETTEPMAELQEVNQQPALVVYQRLLESYQAGKSTGLPTLELLRTWSLRVAENPIDQLPIGFPLPEGAVAQARETIINAMESHTKRMNELGKIVRMSNKAGKAEHIDVAAVEYYTEEAERLPRKFETLQRVLHQETEVDVVLPEFIPVTPLIASKELIVNVDDTGKIKVRGKNLTLDQFKKLLQDEKSNNGKLSLLLRCDPKVKHSEVTAIIDIAGEFSANVSILLLDNSDSERGE